MVCPFFSPLLGEKIACITEYFALAEFYCLNVGFRGWGGELYVWRVYLKIEELCLVLWYFCWCLLPQKFLLGWLLRCWVLQTQTLSTQRHGLLSETSLPLLQESEQAIDDWVWLTLGYYKSFHAILSDKHENILGSSFGSWHCVCLVCQASLPCSATTLRASFEEMYWFYNCSLDFFIIVHFYLIDFLST